MDGEDKVGGGDGFSSAETRGVEERGTQTPVKAKGEPELAG